jgi:Putative DNA-binding domain
MWHNPIASDFADAVLNPSLAKPASVIGPNGKAAEKRFNVYRNNVAYSLVEALGKNYPAVKAECGGERFTDAALLYLGDHPPRSKMMFELGGNFAAWLDGFAPAKAQMPWLADLAKLERAWLDSYHAADADPLDPAIFSAISPDALGDLRFVKHPATAIICSEFSIHAMLEAGRNGLPTPNQIGQQNVLITRPQFAVEVTLLPKGSALFFEFICSGKALGEAAEAAFAQQPEFDFSANLGTLFQSGATIALA